MKLEVIRFSSQNDSTLGLLFDVTHGRKFLCFTLEDEARDTKVMGETRIPAGIYDLKLRTEGGYHNRFLKKFGPALGDSSQQNVSKGGFIGASNDAYKRVYPVIADAILSGQRVRVKYIDYDNGVRLS